MAYIQSGQNAAGAGTVAVTLTGVTANSLIYGVARAFGAASGLTITDDQGGTVVKSVTALTVNDDYFVLWYILAASAATHVFTLSSGVADTVLLAAVEYGGLTGTAVDAALVTNTGTSSTATGTTITTVATNALVVSVAAAQPADSDTTWTATGGCTIRETVETSTPEKRQIAGDQVKAAAGNVTDTFTLDASMPWGVKTISFSGLPATVIPVFMNQYRQRGN